MKENAIFIDYRIKHIKEREYLSQKITYLDLGSGVVKIDNMAFADNYISKLIIPGNVVHINFGAFIKNRIKCLTLNEGLEKIGKGSFWGNQIDGLIAIPSTVREVGTSAFENNNIEKVLFLGDIKHIRCKSFQDNKITIIQFNGIVLNKTKNAFKNNGPHRKSNSLPTDEDWTGTWVLTEEDNYKNWKKIIK
jgi:hypothetical protein